MPKACLDARKFVVDNVRMSKVGLFCSTYKKHAVQKKTIAGNEPGIPIYMYSGLWCSVDCVTNSIGKHGYLSVPKIAKNEAPNCAILGL